MRQVIEIPNVPLCDATRPSWFGRLRAKLAGSGEVRRLVALERCSRHLLRDIGLSDGPRSNRLMQDHHLFRR